MGIGMVVSRHRVTAVIVRGREVAWEFAAVVDGDVGVAIRDVLGRLPRQIWWGRVRVRVAIDDPLSTVKTIRGLPPVRNAGSLTRVLATAPARFFVLPGRSAVVTGIRVVAPGVVRAAAFDAQLVDAIRSGAGAARVTVTSIVPACVAVQVLSEREREHPLAAAIGATILSPREPISVRTPRRRARNARIGRTRLAAAGVAAVSSATGAAVLPARYDVHAAPPAHHPQVQVPSTSGALTSLDDEHALAARSLASAFDQGRTSVTLLLGALAAALPERVTVVGFRADESGVSISAVAPRAVDVVRALERVPHISTIELAGPIVHAPGENERVTLHFRPAPDPPEAWATPVTPTPSRPAATPNTAEPAEQHNQGLHPAVIESRDHAEAATSLAALVNDEANRVGVRIGTLQLSGDSVGPGHLFRLTIRGDATGDISCLVHFLAVLESARVSLAVRELALTPGTPGATASDSGSVRAEFTLEVLAMTRPSRPRL